MNRLFLTASLLIFAFAASAQSANAPLNTDYYHLIDRYEILSGSFSEYFHTNVKPYQREDIASFVDDLLADSNRWHYRDKYNLLYLANDNWDYSEFDQSDSSRPFWTNFYRKKPDLYHVEEKDFTLHINPVIHLSAGKESASDILTYTNTRGVDVRGNIARKVAFYTRIETTQAIYPLYVRDWEDENGVIPYEGFWKQFDEDGYDFFTARGYVSFDVVDKYVNAQFGFDKNVIGNGHRSFFLSDFSNAYAFFKLNTKIWRINYTNLFTQAIAQHSGGDYGSAGVVRFPKKFVAAHHLSLNITDNINIGLFEAVVSGDSTGTFNVGYLNPIIFYRALEHQDGSIDNAMVGFDYKINFARHFSFYGQILLDEFKRDEITSGNGWWANKFGIQTGLKYINIFGINNLDGQIEYNIARPFLYQHQDIYTNYANYNMPLGHTLGGNFKEVIGILRAQPAKRLSIVAQLNLASYGEDPDEETNWGKDVMKSYTTRVQDYDNTIGQGIATDLFYGQMTFMYMLKHNLFIDLSGAIRKIDSELDERDSNTTYFSGSLRWNIPRRTFDF